MTENVGPPAVQQLGPAVVIRGDALDVLYRSLMAGARDARRNGYSVSPFVALQAATLAAHRAKSDVGHGNTGLEATTSDSGCQGDDWLSIAEAAALSGYCARQLRRRARSGLGRRVGSSWVIARRDALALKAERDWKARNASRRIPNGLPGLVEAGTRATG